MERIIKPIWLYIEIDWVNILSKLKLINFIHSCHSMSCTTSSSSTTVKTAWPNSRKTSKRNPSSNKLSSKRQTIIKKHPSSKTFSKTNNKSLLKQNLWPLDNCQEIWKYIFQDLQVLLESSKKFHTLTKLCQKFLLGCPNKRKDWLLIGCWNKVTSLSQVPKSPNNWWKRKEFKAINHPIWE